MRRAAFLPIVAAATAAAVTASCGAESGGEAAGDDPVARWESLRPGEPVPATLSFAEPLADSTVVVLLDRAGVRPYRAFVALDAMRSSRQVERSQASSEFLSRLRDELLADMRISRCAQPGRAGALLQEWSDESVETGRTVLAHLDAVERSTAALARGEPYLYGVSVVGPAEDVREVASDPRVTDLAVGDPAGDDGEPPDARAADAPPAGLPDDVASLTPEELRRRLQSVAESVEGCGPREGGRDDPGTPTPPPPGR